MAIQDAIPAAIRLILGDPEFDVGWNNREARYRADRHVLLTLTSRPRRGVDETRYADPVDGVMRERIYGVRRLMIQIQVETQDQDIEDSAHALAETIRTGIHRSDVEALLDASDLGGAQVTEPRQIDYPDDSGRWRSAVMMELWLNTHTTHTGPEVAAVGSVEVSGEILPDGPDVGPFTVSE